MAGKKRIVNRFAELLAIKSRKEGRKISRQEVADAIGVSRSALDSYARNEVTRFDAPIVLALCNYFECEPGDLLVTEETEEDLGTELLLVT